MKVKVNDRCIGCGACVAITDGEIFDFNDAVLAEPINEEVNEDKKELIEDAARVLQ